MIRQSRKNGWFQVECSDCKHPCKFSGETEAAALSLAEKMQGFAVSGKFHFCHECFAKMLERWKANDRDAVRGQRDEGN